MKKKILLIIGAGASIDFGMPSVGDIDLLFEKWLSGVLEIDSQNKSLYKYLQDEIYTNVGKLPNYEEVLHTSMLLHSIAVGHTKNPLSTFVKLDTFPKIIKNSERTDITGCDFSFMVQCVVDKLLENFRGRCLKVQNDYKDQFNSLKEFFKKLNNEFEIGVVTLNYDNVILQAIPNLKTGFSLTGDFLPSEIICSNDWHFCYHLHGSVHFDMQADKNKIDMHQIKWNNDLRAAFTQNSSGRNSQLTNESIDVITSNIIAGYNKTNQILGRYPFSLYYSDMIRKISEADGFIFIGYGFNDYHLNHAFKESLVINRKRPIVVIDSTDNAQCMQNRCDKWAYNLCETIPIDKSMIGLNGVSSPLHMQEIKQSKVMEVSNNPDYPLALWYNGLLDMCNHYDVLRAEL